VNQLLATNLIRRKTPSLLGRAPRVVHLLGRLGRLFLTWSGISADAAAAAPTSLAEAVARVAPGVVNIRTTDMAPNQTGQDKKALPADQIFSMLLGTSPTAEPGLQGTTRSIGSGFFWSDTGTIVTNHHVIKDAASIVIYATELEIYRKAEVLGSDPRMDLALLRVQPVPRAKALELGTSALTQPGDTVFAIGNPFGYGNSVSGGILSAKGRAVGPGSLSHLLQTDVPLNPGNSGGPLFDQNGQLIGINTANVIDAQGISFAIPAETARARLEAMRSAAVRPSAGVRSVSRPWLGLEVGDILDDPRFSGESYGIAVRTVMKGSPADRAGLKKGDVIQEAAGQRLNHTGQLEALLVTMKANQTIRLKVYRQGKSQALSIPLSPQPESLAKQIQNNIL
jgi:serine protease Do